MFGIISCQPEEWAEHYEDHEEWVNMKLWTAVQEEARFSRFTAEMEAYGLDSVILSDQAFTLFIPDNEAFEAFVDTIDLFEQLLKYHISYTVQNSRNIEGGKRLQTLSDKYTHIELSGNDFLYDGHPVKESSPLYLDGRYYVLSEVAIPRPNLYEFTEIYSPVMKEYIDSRDSVSLDFSESKPLGYDEQGNTIYDSVFAVVNLFERDYFPVSQEFRDKTATFIVFTEAQYNQALDEMAENLSGVYNSHLDIPLSWQFETFLPEVIKKSMFSNMLPYEAFMQENLRSITGDTVEVNYESIDPGSKYTCSNGLIYTYSDFSVPDSLYRGEIRMEMEALIDTIGAGVWTWSDSVDISGFGLEPVEEYNESASGDFVVSGSLPRNYEGEFNFQFKFRNVFPMRYRLEWRGGSRPSGVYAVHVNELKVGEFDTDGFRSSVVSVTGERFIPVESFNIKDFWVDHLEVYGDVTVRFEYLGPGRRNPEGFVIDYVSLVPYIE